MNLVPPNSFTDGERAAIEAAFLKNGYATCPEDRSLLEIKSIREEGPITHLMATCQDCGRHSSWEREPREYRKWTQAECASLTSCLVVNGPGSANCPIEDCEAQVLLMAPRTPFPQPLCPGCGNAGRGV